TLKASGSTGTAPLNYSWNTGATTSSFFVTPTVTTTYTVTVSNTCGSDSDEVTVTVITEQIANAGTNQSDVCLSAMLFANTPSSGTGSWTIESGSGGLVGASSMPNSSFFGTEGETYTLRWTITTSCTISYDEVDISFAILPTANAGGDVTICNGSNTTLNASGSTGTAPNYLWNTGASNSSLNVSPSVTTTYTVTVTNTCGSDSDEVTVTVHSALSANAGADVSSSCGGINTTLDASGSTGTAPLSYSWNTGTTNSSLNVSPSVTTTYTVTVTSTCGSDSDEVTVIADLTDSRDGNTYTTILIGTQCWMTQNLAYLPSVVNSLTGSDNDPYYYVYDYQGTDVNAAKATNNYETYGVLYNWPAIMDGSSSSNSVPSGVQGACPNGWHVPSDEEWKILEGTVDSYYGYPASVWNLLYWRGTDAGGNIKETGTTHWGPPNNGASNSSGFSALPGGYRYHGGSFNKLRNWGYLWSSTENSSKAYFRFLNNTSGTGIYRDSYEKARAFSLRCLKD
ncbi:MAG: hypothetical protein GY752_12060, partial [bacterium]|nr:hypothetical protein [bacterium]